MKKKNQEDETRTGKKDYTNTFYKKVQHDQNFVGCDGKSKARKNQHGKKN